MDGAKDRDCTGSGDRDDRREAEEMRAAEEMAKKTMGEGGSSLMHMTAPIEGKVYLKALHLKNTMKPDCAARPQFCALSYTIECDI